MKLVSWNVNGIRASIKKGFDKASQLNKLSNMNLLSIIIIFFQSKNLFFGYTFQVWLPELLVLT